MLPNADNSQPGGDSVCLSDTDTLEDVARKIMQVFPGVGWHTAWIRAVRLIKSV